MLIYERPLMLKMYFSVESKLIQFNQTLNKLRKIERKYSKVELTDFKDEGQNVNAHVELLKQTIT